MAIAAAAVTWITTLRRTVAERTAALTQNEERYRDLVETSHDLIWSVDVEGKFTFVNRDAAMHILGYEPEEMIGRSLAYFKTPEQAEKDLKSFAKIKETGGASNYETSYRRKDGSFVPMNFNAVIVKDSSGKILGTTGTAQDISERKQAEEVLKRHLELEEAISDLQSQYITEDDWRGVFDRMLGKVLGLTNSEYGFIGEVLYDDEDKPYLKTYALTNIAWDGETRKFYEENAPEGLVFSNLDTLFGAVMKTGEPVIANDPANDPRSGGLPKGHPPLDAFLGIPFLKGKRLVGMMGIPGADPYRLICEDTMSKTVLVVEDDENSMILFTELLLAKGVETLQAGNGMEALKLAREHVPDLVIMDIQLPDISGLEVTRKLKEDEKLRDIPIIAMTAYALRGDEEACRKAGCVGYIAKPISINNFNEAVDKHIG